MATAERILKLERGIVYSMEREIRQVMVQRKQESELEDRRQVIARRHNELEERKRAEQVVKAEEAAARAAASKIRHKRTQRNNEEQRQLMLEVEERRRERADERYERTIKERDVVKERYKAEGEAKMEYVRQVKAQFEVIHEEKKQEVLRRLEAGQERHLRKLEQTKVDMEEHKKKELLKDKKSAEKREAHRQYKEEMRQQAEDTLKKKYEQAASLQLKKASEIQSLEHVKETFTVKKREMMQLMAEAHRTGNMSKVHDALAELKAHQTQMEEKARQEWAAQSRNGIQSSQRRAQSASPRHSSSNLSSPVKPGFLTRRSSRPVSAGALRSPAAAASGYSPNAFSLERTVSPGRSPRRPVSPQQHNQDAPPTGAHYNHLMNLFKERLNSTDQNNQLF